VLTDIEQRILSHIHPDEVIAWTQALVRIPSVYRPATGETEAPAAQWVADRLREMGLATSVEEAAPGRPNVIGLYDAGADGPRLMFEGHTDVVTEGPRDAWTHDPFGGEIANGRIYGRGACDMKGGLVAAMAAVKALVASGVQLKGSILIAALADEEGSMSGVKHFVQNGWADRVDAAIICEPEDNRLCIAQKGVMWVRVTCEGQMAHGAMPRTGVNPIYPMAHFLVRVQELERGEIARHGSHELLGEPSITPTICAAPPPGQGEPQNNVMPARCQATLDLRLVPDQSPTELETELCSLLHQMERAHPGCRMSLEVLETRPPTATPKDHPLVETLAGAYRDLTGHEPVFGGVPGSTDGTILHVERGVPIVTCGPGDTFLPHQVDEYLDIEQLITATQLYALAAARFLGVDKGT
jgi:succinyl-diaminopimelate desuccinylase